MSHEYALTNHDTKPSREKLVFIATLKQLMIKCIFNTLLSKIIFSHYHYFCHILEC